MEKGHPSRQAGGTGEEGGTFGSLLGQSAFWALVDSFSKHCWQLLCVQPAGELLSECTVNVCRKEEGKGGRGGGGKGRGKGRKEEARETGRTGETEERGTEEG